MIRDALRAVWFSFGVILLLAQFAAACTVPDGYRTNIRPNAGPNPTNIVAALGVVDFMGVDDVNQQLRLDLRATLTWQDPRLIGLEGCRFNVTEVWFPPIAIFNSSNVRTARTNARNQVAIGINGEVTYLQRFTGTISSYHNLRDFPFDNQNFRIDIGSLEFGHEDIAFVADNANTWISDRLNIEGWNVNGVKLQAKTFYVPVVARDTSVLTLFISADRSGEFYIYRVILLLMFVVGMSWAIFWVPPSRFEFQIGLGATSMLTAIAFNLALSTQLPTLGYLTVLDKILIWAISLIFLSIVEALWAGLLVLKDREQEAVRLDKISRIVFPSLLFLGWALIAASELR